MHITHTYSHESTHIDTLPVVSTYIIVNVKVSKQNLHRPKLAALCFKPSTITQATEFVGGGRHFSMPHPQCKAKAILWHL